MYQLAKSLSLGHNNNSINIIFYLFWHVSLRNTDLVGHPEQRVDIVLLNVCRPHDVGRVTPGLLLQHPFHIQVVAGSQGPCLQGGLMSIDRLQHGRVGRGDGHIPLLACLLPRLGNDHGRLTLLFDDGTGGRGLKNGGHESRGGAAAVASKTRRLGWRVVHRGQALGGRGGAPKKPFVGRECTAGAGTGGGGVCPPSRVLAQLELGPGQAGSRGTVCVVGLVGEK